MRMILIAALIAASGLQGCIGVEATKNRAISEAQDHCTSEGKRFHLNSVEVRYPDVIVSANCLDKTDSEGRVPANTQSVR